MGKLLHASYSGYFPFCISSGGIPPQSYNTITDEIPLQDAMDIYWNIKSLSLNISINTSWTFKFYPFYPSLIDPVIARQSVIYNASALFEDRSIPINNDPIKLVCYNSAYLEYGAIFKEIGQNIEQSIDPPEDPYIQNISASLAASFIGFPSNLFGTIKKTPDNKYGCGARFDIVGTAVWPISTEPTAQYNFLAGRFSAPYLGERDIFLQVDYGPDVEEVSLEQSSGSGISIEISSTQNWS